MDSITKFDGINYANTFAKKINVMHELVKSILSSQLREGDEIIDIGGGPGMGARNRRIGNKINADQYRAFFHDR